MTTLSSRRWAPGVGAAVLLAAIGSASSSTPQLDDRHPAQVSAGDPGLSRANGVLLLGGAPLTGQVTDTYPDGALKSVATYRQGRRHGRSSAWYANGQTRYERSYAEGLEHGVHLGWWNDGSARFTYFFEDGRHEGQAREWAADGRLYRDFNYVDGKESGQQRMWYADGTLRANYVIRDGWRYGLIGAKGCVGDEPDAQNAEVALSAVVVL